MNNSNVQCSALSAQRSLSLREELNLATNYKRQASPNSTNRPSVGLPLSRIPPGNDWDRRHAAVLSMPHGVDVTSNILDRKIFRIPPSDVTSIAYTCRWTYTCRCTCDFVKDNSTQSGMIYLILELFNRPQGHYTPPTPLDAPLCLIYIYVSPAAARIQVLVKPLPSTLKKHTRSNVERLTRQRERSAASTIRERTLSVGHMEEAWIGAQDEPPQLVPLEEGPPLGAHGYLYTLHGQKRSMRDFPIVNNVDPTTELPVVDASNFFKGSPRFPDIPLHQSRVVVDSHKFLVVGYIDQYIPRNQTLAGISRNLIWRGELAVFQLGIRVPILSRFSVASNIVNKALRLFMSRVLEAVEEDEEPPVNIIYSGWIRYLIQSTFKGLINDTYTCSIRTYALCILYTNYADANARDVIPNSGSHLFASSTGTMPLRRNGTPSSSSRTHLRES
ncbi:uncharacterized protein LACBIDRAFT_335358 [Laccaria bicolor S238N-H82]|uniref:Predicted protein n=1 Tax=Laccaria bicolor (strain S238N-H82 / ATCC MYA-4686) TaxID=486041 RepID=B0E243_LACBS|nr:uncharacterized protein LACBIDRAFT_335358 [Laccaria bicolor S238N-H82]EDQ99130.1 predicted protein [Laccaria bicolor S238N-H82]|eukprot:XP_001890263.1 predicted protein [Laccaria bicolor S238N-H82]